ncbi:MAG: mechanosensitive ion channel domain-containing protein [Pseudomonadota bacterium]
MRHIAGLLGIILWLGVGVSLAQTSQEQEVQVLAQASILSQSEESLESNSKTDLLTRFTTPFTHLLHSIKNWNQLLLEYQRYGLGLDREAANDLRMYVFTYVLIFVFLSAAVEWFYYRHFILPKLTAWHRAASASTRAILLTLLNHMLISLSSILVFGGTALALFEIFLPETVHDDFPFLYISIRSLLFGILSFRVMQTLLQVFLSPKQRHLRLIPLSNRRARQIYFRLLVLALITVSGGTIVGNLGLLGAPTEIQDVIDSIFLFATLIVILIFVWQDYLFKPFNKDVEIDYREKNLPSTLFTTLVILVASFFWITQLYAITWLIGFVYFLPGLIRIVNNTVSYIIHKNLLRAHRAASEGKLPKIAQEDFSPYDWLDDEKALVYLPFIQRIIRNSIVVFFASGLYTGFRFQLEWEGLAFASAFEAFQSQYFIMLGVLFFADLFWVWLKTIIDDRVNRAPPPEPGKAQGADSRLLTLLPLIKKAILVFLLVIIAMIVLSTLGVNIAPLIASAGVLGIAIGFGAQKLVEDVISGIFFLVDDAFRIGEYIEMGEIRGTVESISLRSLRLRHHRGAIHTLPYSSLSSS